MEVEEGRGFRDIAISLFWDVFRIVLKSEKRTLLKTSLAIDEGGDEAALTCNIDDLEAGAPADDGNTVGGDDMTVDDVQRLFSKSSSL